MKSVSNKYPEPTPIPNAITRSLARPVASWKIAKLEFNPRPCKNIRRKLVPEPLGATNITSTSAGGTIPVRSLYVTANPCEKYNALPGVRASFTVGHTSI